MVAIFEDTWIEVIVDIFIIRFLDIVVQSGAAAPRLTQGVDVFLIKADALSSEADKPLKLGVFFLLREVMVDDIGYHRHA